MKRFPKIYLRLLMATFLVILLLPAHYLLRSGKLGFFRDHSAVKLAQLTIQEKVEELEYFKEFIHTHYPYLEVIKSEKGATQFDSTEQQIIQRGLESKNNKEYLKAILEYLMVLMQGTSHAEVHRVNEQPKSNFKFGHGYLSILPFTCQVGIKLELF